jgi:hypothetical protein
VSAHRVRLNFSDSILGAELICPPNRSECANTCPCCDADLSDADSKRCRECEETNVDECWLRSWFDNVEPEELLAGSVEFPIAVEVGESGEPFCRIEAAA